MSNSESRYHLGLGDSANYLNAMSHTREKFNTKARQSAAGPSRKKSKQKNRTEDASQVQIDPNVTIYVPKTREEKEQEKKEKLRKEV